MIVQVLLADWTALPIPILCALLGLLSLFWAVSPDGLDLGFVKFPPSRPLARQIFIGLCGLPFWAIAIIDLFQPTWSSQIASRSATPSPPPMSIRSPISPPSEIHVVTTPPPKTAVEVTQSALAAARIPTLTPAAKPTSTAAPVPLANAKPMPTVVSKARPITTLKPAPPQQPVLPAGLTLVNATILLNAESIRTEAVSYHQGYDLLVPSEVLYRVITVCQGELSYSPWDKSITASKSGAEVEASVGSQQVIINGQSRPLDYAPMFVSGKLFVPLRVFATGLGALVDDVGNGTYTIQYIPATQRP